MSVRTTIRAKLVSLGAFPDEDLDLARERHVAVFVCASVEDLRVLGRWMYEDIEIAIRLANEGSGTETTSTPSRTDPVDASMLDDAARAQLTAQLLGKAPPAGLTREAIDERLDGERASWNERDAELRAIERAADPAARSERPTAERAPVLSKPSYEPSADDLSLSASEAAELGRLEEKAQVTPAGGEVRQAQHHLCKKGLAVLRDHRDRQGAAGMLCMITARGIRIARELRESSSR